jgi:Kef-type K+ transport system membrane component KefB/nucleotide-binding universal stress UspA family protein
MNVPIAMVLLDAEKSTHATPLIFFAELVLMLLAGRLLGELMLRLRQPEVLGQLLAGILLGPTILGNVWPAAHHFLFPDTLEQQQMIDGISQLGILMLLVVAGMEIDFGIVRRRKRMAFFSSVSGIVLPFACGLVLGELLPDSLLPAPEKRLVTALFLATALSISSIKIVAMVIMELDFMRRNIGQLILASAIIDDTIGWIIVAVISGLAAGSTLSLKGVGFAVGGTAIFLGLSFTFGRTLVTHLIRWTNDTLYLDFSVLSVILILMCAMSIATDLIGVHTVLGAFVTGILVGQSPMMTDHIREQLRGIIVALFAPIFFGVAGLSVDLTILKDWRMLALAIGLILIASLGKLVGCFSGAKLGGLTNREGLALAIGMNARGTTEVIVASIGLSIGVLTKDFYTLIVVMAVTTTMAMPPMLRWALARIPLSKAEKERLDREAAEAKDFLPKVERLLIAADETEWGELGALLGGLVVGTRQILTTVLDLDSVGKNGQPQPILNEKLADRVRAALEIAARNEPAAPKQSENVVSPQSPPAQITTVVSSEEPTTAIFAEIENSHDLVFVGVENALSLTGKSPGALSSSIEKVIRDFTGPLAIAIPKGIGPAKLTGDSLNILVPATGTNYSRLASELAIAIAKACHGSVTALNVSPPPDNRSVSANARQLKPGREVLKDIQEIGKREAVRVKTVAEIRGSAEPAILRQIKKGKHNLLLIGAHLRPGGQLFFGHSLPALLKKSPCSLLIVSSR